MKIKANNLLLHIKENKGEKVKVIKNTTICAKKKFIKKVAELYYLVSLKND